MRTIITIVKNERNPGEYLYSVKPSGGGRKIIDARAGFGVDVASSTAANLLIKWDPATLIAPTEIKKLIPRELGGES